MAIPPWSRSTRRSDRASGVQATIGPPGQPPRNGSFVLLVGLTKLSSESWFFVERNESHERCGEGACQTTSYGDRASRPNRSVLEDKIPRGTQTNTVPGPRRAKNETRSHSTALALKQLLIAASGDGNATLLGDYELAMLIDYGVDAML